MKTSKHSLFLAVVAVTIAACNSKSESPATPAPKVAPVETVQAAAAPLPTTPEPTVAVAKPEFVGTTTKINGFLQPTVVDLPAGFVMRKHQDEDGEGDSVFAKSKAMEVDFISPQELGIPSSKVFRHGVEYDDKNTTWIVDEESDEQIWFVYEQKGKFHVDVFRKQVNGWCSAHRIQSSRVDEVLAGRES
jgi:hypothetical protein